MRRKKKYQSNTGYPALQSSIQPTQNITSVALTNIKTTNNYTVEDADTILRDYTYFETFTGADPSNRETTSSKFIAKHAKCYQNMRNQNTFLLVWHANDKNVQLEYLTTEELENLLEGHISISTSAHPIDQSVSSVAKISTELHDSPVKHLIPFLKSSLDIQVIDNDIFEHFIGADPYARDSALDRKRITKCFKHKYKNDHYLLIWNIFDESYIREEVSIGGYAVSEHFRSLP
jgi:hypothetical protein